MELTVAGGYFIPGKTPQVINNVNELIALGYVPYGTPTYNEASGWVSQLMVLGYGGSATDYTLTTGYLDKTPYFPKKPPVNGNWVLLGSLLARSNNFYVHAWLDGVAAGPAIDLANTTGNLPLDRTTGTLDFGTRVTGNVPLASRVSGTLPIANGGTGATAAAGARSNLGAASLAANTFTGQQIIDVDGEAIRIIHTNASTSSTIISRRADNTAAWTLGKNGAGNDVVLQNNPTGQTISLNAAGDISLTTTSSASTVTVNGTTLSVASSNGRTFTYVNSSTSGYNGAIELWGNTTGRAGVMEFRLSDAYLFYAQRNSDGTRQMTMNGAMNATAFNNSSDRELKDDIAEIVGACDSILKMHGYTYTLKESGMPYAGVIAQEVMEAVPEAVGSFEKYEGNDSSSAVIGRFFNVDQGGVVGLLVQVCREQELRIRALEEKLK